jgi:hypothetical protein
LWKFSESKNLQFHFCPNKTKAYKEPAVLTKQRSGFIYKAIWPVLRFFENRDCISGWVVRMSSKIRVIYQNWVFFKLKKGELQLYICLRTTLRTVNYLVPFLLSAYYYYFIFICEFLFALRWGKDFTSFMVVTKCWTINLSLRSCPIWVGVYTCVVGMVSPLCDTILVPVSKVLHIFDTIWIMVSKCF